MDWLNIAGIVLQIVGVVVTALGLWFTWRDYTASAAASDRLFDDLRTAVQEAFGKALFWVAKVADDMHIRATTDVRRGGAWVDVPSDSHDAIANLEQRSERLADAVAFAGTRLAEALKESRAAADELRTLLGDAVREADRQVRKAATGGIKVAAIGLMFLVAGLVLQLVAAVQVLMVAQLVMVAHRLA